MLLNNDSSYTLATVQHDNNDNRESSSLLSAPSSSSSYGTTPIRPPQHARIIIFNATLKMAFIFILSCILLGGTLWISLPTLEPYVLYPPPLPFFNPAPILERTARYCGYQSRLPTFRISTISSRSTATYILSASSSLTSSLTSCELALRPIPLSPPDHPLSLQAFSLPGSMYLSILGGAVWGVARALPLACACVATGATLCYFISAALGPALLTIPSFQSRLGIWSSRISTQRANLIPFLIVLRIAPLPPHWVVNVLAPHLGIGLIPFWCSTFLGIFGVTVIHTSIGGGLDEMTSAADFNLISWRNFLTLAAVVVGAMIPVGIRYAFAREVADVGDEEPHVVLEGEDYAILARGAPLSPLAKNKQVQNSLIMLPDDDEGAFSGDDVGDESDEDVTLEAGPALVIKGKELEPPPSPGHRRTTSISSSSSNV